MNNDDKKSFKVYLDSNFLLSYWIKDHKYYDDARKKFFELIEKELEIFISPLVLDEVWYKMSKLLRDKVSYNKQFRDYYDKFKEMMNYIEERNLVKLIQFKSNLVFGCREALENIKEFNFKTHDAFHLAMMKDNEIYAIVTKDSDFTKAENKMRLEKKGFQVIGF